MLLVVLRSHARHGDPHFCVQFLVVLFEAKRIHTHGQVSSGPATDGVAEVGTFWKENIHNQPMELFRLVVTKWMIAPSHLFRRKVFLLHLHLLLVFSLILDLVPKLSLVLQFLLFCPFLCLTPITAMLVVIPVVFKTCLACSFELFEGTPFKHQAYSVQPCTKGSDSTSLHPPCKFCFCSLEDRLASTALPCSSWYNGLGRKASQCTGGQWEAPLYPVALQLGSLVSLAGINVPLPTFFLLPLAPTSNG